MRKLITHLYYRYIKRDKTPELHDFLNTSQYMPEIELKQYQLDCFQKIWLHAVENVPYYSEIAKKHKLGKCDIKTLNDFVKIPVLTKEIVRKEFDKMMAKNLDKKRFVPTSTSGSTGSNFHFFVDSAKKPFNQALERRKYEMMGTSIFDRELIIWGASFDIEKSKKRKFAVIKDWVKNKKVVSGYNLSDEGIKEIYRTMESYRPLIIKSYPSILMTICHYFNIHNLIYRPKAIHIGGEKLFDFQRKEIERTFGCPVYDYYAARDMSQIACNCEEKNGLHVFMENVILEVLNEEGIPIEEGEGDIVVTDLHNYVMPFIRYKIGDRAKISKKNKCKCGRNLVLVNEIIGRRFEIIEFPNGNRVGGTFWTLVMKAIPGIKDFQIIQQNKSHIIVNYVPEDLNPISNFDNIIKHIHKYSGENLVIDFHKMKKIPVSKAGKMQFVIKS